MISTFHYQGSTFGFQYLSTDSIMFRSPFTTDESLDGSPGIKLKNMQDEQWGPVQVKIIPYSRLLALF